MKDDRHFYENARFAFILQLQELLMSCPDKCTNLVYPQILQYDAAIEKMDLCVITGMASHAWYLVSFCATFKLLRDSPTANRRLVASTVAAHWVAMARRYGDDVNTILHDNIWMEIRRIFYNDRLLFSEIVILLKIDEIALRIRNARMGFLWFGEQETQTRTIFANPIHLNYLDSVDMGHRGELRLMKTVAARSATGLLALSRLNPDELPDELPDETIINWIRADYEAQLLTPSEVLRKHLPDCKNRGISFVKKLSGAFFPSGMSEDSLERFRGFAGRNIYDVCVFFGEKSGIFFHDGLIAHFSALNAKDEAAMFWHSDVMTRNRLGAAAFHRTLEVIKKYFPVMFSELSRSVIHSMKPGWRKITFRQYSRSALTILCQMIPELWRRRARSFRVVCEEIFLNRHVNHEAYDEVMEHLPILYRAFSENVKVSAAWKMIKKHPSTRAFAKGRIFSLLDVFKFPKRKEVTAAMFEVIASGYSYKKRKREYSSDDEDSADRVDKIRKIAQ